MSKPAALRYDILVIGGGPAGLAAAARAAEAGASVAIADDNFRLGGQIWRSSASEENPAATPWVHRVQRSNVIPLCGLRVYHQIRKGVLLAESGDDVQELQYDKLILATGARERFLPFPGWTLPNVLGAGGLQAMVKSGLPIRGKRVVIAGTGPLLLAVAACLRKHGAQILMVCEQASMSALARMAINLLGYPGKLAEAFRLKRQLIGVPFATSSWPLAANGNRLVEDVTISRRGEVLTLACDYLACGFHLIPNTEVAELLGCQIKDGCVVVDELQRTSVPEIFCAGEPTGIGGLELSLVEGEIAGLAASGQSAIPSSLLQKRRQARSFANLLEKTFRLRQELKCLASAETIVCRCEDVAYSRLGKYASWRAAKLQTRCGMGPCQGRVCGPATEFLFSWNPESVRPPVFPVRVASLAAVAGVSEPVHEEILGGHG